MKKIIESYKNKVIDKTMEQMSKEKSDILASDPTVLAINTLKKQIEEKFGISGIRFTIPHEELLSGETIAEVQKVTDKYEQKIDDFKFQMETLENLITSDLSAEIKFKLMKDQGVLNKKGAISEITSL